MFRLFNTVSRLGLSAAGNAALVGVAGAVFACGAALTALYLIDNIDETPAIRELQCFLGIERPDCPRQMEEMARLQDELDDLLVRTRTAEDSLRGLRAVNDVDTVTFFQRHDVPDSSQTVHVGTVYSHLIGNPPPQHHFCYIALPSGTAGESRHLHFYGPFGPIAISPDAMRAAGISEATLRHAHSVCQPFLIGRSG